MRLSEYTNLFYEVWRTRVSVRTPLTEEDFEKFLKTVDYINNLTEDLSQVGFELLSTWRIDSKLGCLILPKKISYEASSSANDLRIRELNDFSLDEIMSKREFEEFQVSFFASLRNQEHFDNDVENLRTERLFNDMMHKMYRTDANGSFAHFVEQEAFVPINLGSLTQGYRTSFFAEDVEEVLYRLFFDLVRNCSR